MQAGFRRFARVGTRTYERRHRPSPSPPGVMAGLVPAIHVLPHRGARREGTGRRPHVDARDKSGHDDRAWSAQRKSKLDSNGLVPDMTEEL